MATARNSHLNGAADGTENHMPVSKRFSDIPREIDIPVQGDQEDEAVELNLEDLVDDPAELCTLFENERVARTYWMTVAIAYAKQNSIDHAIEMLIRGGNAMQNNNPKEKLSMVTCLCWMYLWKSREAPRVAPEGVLVSEAKTKEFYLNQATQSLNEALRINPAFPPLFLARGVIYLLKASLVSPSKAPGPTAIDPEKADLLRNALRAFEDAIRVSHNKNVLALMGKARTLFSLTKYAEALSLYQEVLRKMPDMVDPDPRIGIGCCFWQLGFKDDAKSAWERCLEINPESKIANILLGLYHLDSSAKVPTNSPEFIRLYKTAMTEFTQKSFKMDKNQPLTCATFAGYFLSRKQLANVESLAHKALQFTDVNNIASDSWYLLARKEHISGNIDTATTYYRRADEARGGLERGYLPAKFGVAQLSVLNNDLGEAKLRLEKMIQQSKSTEAMALLGTLYAEEVFANQYAAVKEDKSAETTKAIQYLETVRGAWKDPKRNQLPDASVLLNLARLYENDHPDKALHCLQQVEQLELDQVPASERPTDVTDETVIRKALRKFLPPQLLNNIGCFYAQAEKHEAASEMFEAALSACVRIGEKDEDMDTDALITTISFNLGRSYESQGQTENAIEVYEKLVARHDDYTDAQARLAYIKLRRNPNKEGPDAVAKLYQATPSDLEVRALYGWYLGRVHSRKRPANVNEDPELRHYKHTLQNYDKHDRYALVGMGNLYMMAGREMRRETDQEKQKRSAMYSRAVEFFDKALQLDPKNAYAAQGIAIALVEDKKDLKTALPIFLKVRETIKDAYVYVNLGHIYAELRQYSKAIESYEQALSKEGKANDTGILACLGRTWLNKAKSNRDLDGYKTALDFAKKALEVAPDQVHFKFNIAFVQIQQVQHIMNVPDAQRTLLQLEDASEGLEAAIEALDQIAASPQPPYPKSDLEQRASMARNTQRKQLARQIESQKEYEERNKEKLAAALEQRQAELKRREEERQKALAAERERQEKIRKEREAIAARDLELAKQRTEEEKTRQAAEFTTDSETGEKIKRKRKSKPSGEGKSKGRSRKKKTEGDDSESEEERQPKKKRRLAAKKENTTKYKSAEVVVDSDSDDDALERAGGAISNDSHVSDAQDKSKAGSDDGKMDVDSHANGAEDDDEDEETATSRRRRRGRVLDDSDEDENSGAVAPEANGRSDGEPAADTSMADAGVDEDDE
ncbi:tetratricopeptide [Pseudomassariella vexata]|uniref:Tetratricopeptide n=1 Tax=Pseudomassariella vexata TaxID=1141098 RepID=A0A1Y2ED79_9PEZI|nr:tetratricopeptide [Pseudomassariella vexata]ORY69521.1 tetratricopeptide [Pseudomassariella vexata]